MSRKYQAIITTEDGVEYIDPIISIELCNSFESYEYDPEDIISITIRSIKDE